MTWSRKDIIADIKKRKLDIDTSLPYWELRREYHQTIYRHSYLGSGSFEFAHGMSAKPPPKVERAEK